MRPLALFERAGAEPSISMGSLFQGSATIAGETECTLKHYIDAIASGGFPGFYEAPPVLRNQQLARTSRAWWTGTCLSRATPRATGRRS